MKNNLEYLVGIMTEASHAYHNDGAYMPINSETINALSQIFPIPDKFQNLQMVTDPFYDYMEDQLRKLDPNNAFLKQVGAPVVVKKKAKLPIHMSGLEKITVADGSVAAFTSTNKGPYLASDKLDGVSIQVEYLPNEIKAYTRGNGMIAEDISYLVPFLKLPKKSPYTNIRGEIVMRKAVFEAKWTDQYENPRNMVAGKVNAGAVHESVGDMDVVIYGVLSDNSEKPSAQLANLKHAGFNVVEHVKLDSLSDDTLSALLKKRKLESPYELDGIVVLTDKEGLTHSVDSPDWGRKFKENVDFYEVKVIGATFTASKDGYLKPRIHIEPTRMGGVTVQNATAFNYKFIVDNKIGVGAIVKISRSGDVIPDIEAVIQPADAVFEPTEPWVWNKTKVDAVVPDPDNHPVVKFKRIVFFFQTLEVDEVGMGTLERCIEAGYDTIDKIIKMTQADWKSIDGFAGRKGEISYTEMQKCFSKVYLPALADASGFFGRGFGTTRFEAILAHYPDLLNMKLTEQKAFDLASKVKSIGGTMAQQFAEGIVQFIPWVESLKDHIKFAEPEKTEVVGQAFAGQGVTFTGFRNADWQLIVEQQGGEYVDFGKKTTMLVYGGKKSGKVQAAADKGIKTLTQGEFLAILQQNGIA